MSTKELLARRIDKILELNDKLYNCTFIYLTLIKFCPQITAETASSNRSQQEFESLVEEVDRVRFSYAGAT
jgi:hypothetical protein